MHINKDNDSEFDQISATYLSTAKKIIKKIPTNQKNPNVTSRCSFNESHVQFKMIPATSRKPTQSLRSSPNNAFETDPVLVGLMMALSHSFKVSH